MTAERAALLAAVCESPDDDLARLVFADWLDEHGELERAEFIRLQIGLAADTVPVDRRPEAEARAAVLLDRHRAAWLAELPRRPGVTWPDSQEQFARGLAGVVWFEHGKAWQDHAAEVFATAPVCRLTCGGQFTARNGRPVLASPLLGRVAEFMAPPLDAAGAAALADNPHLTGRLRDLYVLNTRHDGDAVAAELSRTAGLRDLGTLVVGGVGSAGAAALAGSPHLTRLRHLRLIASTVGDDGAEALAASPSLAAIEELMLSYSGIGDRGAAALARSDRLPSLRELFLGGGCPVTDAGAAAIAAGAGLPRLTDLHLWGTRIGEAGARALCGFAERRGLRLLNLRDCPVPADAAREIADRLRPNRVQF